MSNKVWWWLGGIVLLGLGALFILKSYQLELIDYIIVNALLQKTAEEEQPGVMEAFKSARERAEQEEKEGLYLQRLIVIFQRVERAQRLNSDDIERIVQDITWFDRAKSKKLIE